ncbi:RraA family protein [Hydrogenophaga sp.]|uniref:RraA family protein n=1 Tax=Hydrogenophaga sp. TaxID=1904254 RepID=UPI00271AB803|nr:RraA family protein [Hydrogenophaga sp.]MDO9436699.1 RraA family protein [Hydrogenophaga sp.]
MSVAMSSPMSALPRHRIHAPPAPAPAALIEALRACPTANLADALPEVAVLLGLTARHTATAPMCGPALTVRVAAGHNLLVQHAIDLARPGDVIVIDGAGDAERALIGEIMSRWALRRGVAGFVIDGAVRDIDHLRQSPLPVYARHVSPRGPVKEGVGEIHGDAHVGGAVVRAGDLIVGDLDGVVSVPVQHAEAAIEACAACAARERDTLDRIRLGTLDRSWIAKALGEKTLR